LTAPKRPSSPLLRPLDAARYEAQLHAGAAVDGRGPIGSPRDWFVQTAPDQLVVDVYNTEVLSVRAR
jgi:hypothetical protein